MSFNSSAMLNTSARYGLSAALFGVLGVLIVVPLAMVIYTAFIDVLPFSGDRAANFTLDNFRDIWSEETGAALAQHR